jgi:hypothetical protein
MVPGQRAYFSLVSKRREINHIKKNPQDRFQHPIICGHFPVCSYDLGLSETQNKKYLRKKVEICHPEYIRLGKE